MKLNVAPITLLGPVSASRMQIGRPKRYLGITTRKRRIRSTSSTERYVFFTREPEEEVCRRSVRPILFVRDVLTLSLMPVTPQPYFWSCRGWRSMILSAHLMTGGFAATALNVCFWGITVTVHLSSRTTQSGRKASCKASSPKSDGGHRRTDRAAEQPGSASRYNELALAEADLSGRACRPIRRFYSRISGDGAYEIERQVVGDILALATCRSARRCPSARFRSALRAGRGDTAPRGGCQTRLLSRVAANELVGLLTEAKSTRGIDCAARRETWPDRISEQLDQAREQVFYAETTAELATLRQEATSSRERLIRLLGLWDGDLGFRLPQKLPALPRRPHSLPRIEVDAVAHRIDLQIARMKLVALAKSLDHGGDPFRHAFGRRRHRPEDARPRHAAFRERGFDVQFQIPIFDGGEVRVRQAGRDLQSGLQPIN